MEERKELIQVKSAPLAAIMESPEKAVEMLNSIKRNFSELLKADNLIIKIPSKGGPKEYVRYEGWVTIATVLGIMPQVRELQQIKPGTYQAKAVAIQIKTGAEVGSGFGICSNEEPNWKGRPDFAIASMAQTRAAAKSLKTILSGVITHLGYESEVAEVVEVEKEDIVQPERNSQGKQAIVEPVAKPETWDEEETQAPESEYSKCNKCGEDILWLKTRNGKNVPINPEAGITKDMIYNKGVMSCHFDTCRQK